MKEIIINENLITVLIASTISLLGILASILINKSNNRQQIKNTKLENKLTMLRERQVKLIEFVYYIKKIQLYIREITLEIDLKGISSNWKTITENIILHKEEINEKWISNTFLFYDNKMKNSLQLGACLHEGASSEIGSIIFLLKQEIKNPDEIKKALLYYHEELQRLIELIVNEQNDFEKKL